MKTLTFEGKVTSPISADETLPIKLTNPLVDDAVTALMEAKGTAQPDGSIVLEGTLTHKFDADFHGIKFPVTFTAEGIATLSAEQA